MTRSLLALAGLLALIGCTDLKDPPADAASGGAASDAGSSDASGSGGAAAAGGSGAGGGGSGAGGGGGSATAGAGGTGACRDCAAAASCRTVDGAPRCVCPEGQIDVDGDGTECVDPCAQAGCSEHARCMANGLEADCQCVSPYVGDGVDCELDATCALLDCDANAECAVDGDARACRCLSGYAGDGMECTNVDDCNPNPCLHGTCADLVDGYECSCETGYSGDTCATDSCTPSPCPVGFDCARAEAGPVCTPPCGSECQLGEPCLEDSHCGDGLSCDADDAVCVGPCAGGAVTSAADLADFRYCSTIDGNLTIEPAGSSFTTIAATDFPHLETLDGSLLVGEIDDTALVSVTMSALERVTGTIRFQAQPGMTLISMPALTSLGSGAADGLVIAQGTTGTLSMPELTTVTGNVTFGLAALDSIDLPKLATVTGNLSFGDFPSPTTDVDLSALRTVSGNLTARYLFSVPFTDVSHLPTGTVTVGGTRTVDEIGCCFINSSTSLTYMCSGTFADYQSYCD